MPLTALQQDVLAVLAPLRRDESQFAGSIVLHATPESPRHSEDFDFFQEVAQEVTRASTCDVAALRDAGFPVELRASSNEWKSDSTIRRARVARGSDCVEIEWAAGFALRFFPIERDPLWGWRLHRFDLAANQALAQACRLDTRNHIDMIESCARFPLASICWAACGKNPGYNPLSLLQRMRRFARIDPVNLAEVQARAIDPQVLKQAWIRSSDEAQNEMTRIADVQLDLPIGVAFVDEQGVPGWIGDDPTLRIHAPSVRGCWPTVRDSES